MRVARKRLTALLLASACSLVAAGTASAGNGGLAPFPPASKGASDLRHLYFYALIFAGALCLLLVGFLGIAVLRGVSGGGKLPGGRALPLVSLGLAAVVLAAVGAYSLVKLDGIKNGPKQALGVTANASSSGWAVNYPNGKTETGTLHVPVGRPVRILLASSDVAHTWWVPALGGAVDALPGRANSTWIEATKPGTYGSFDRRSPVQVVALAQPDFDTWYAQGGKK